ncbi:MAG: hypothetical protein EKK55_17410 [Rhodocyclaceae bacterium]|nr:MAG: hypothetical protein EKK55_17410 [Rhodocyclaceae bacterium]
MSSSEARKFHAERRVLSPTERSNLQREMMRNEGDLRGETEGIPREMKDAIQKGLPIDRGMLIRRNQKLGGILRNGEVPNLSQSEREGLEKDAKQLEEQLKKRMLTRSALGLKPGSPEYRKAVNHMTQVELSKEHNDMAQKWKNIQRSLHPDDADASNLERIRPQ